MYLFITPGAMHLVSFYVIDVLTRRYPGLLEDSQQLKIVFKIVTTMNLKKIKTVVFLIFELHLKDFFNLKWLLFNKITN